ncbi:polyhydroxyalkanoate synthesis repressor PhaR [Polynucleobacter rarus]|uniref:polyhydroxyalkanoate synthesis repressor PhaR n=1 Tax=Polynucleobacter rarus TaxID=556055 RepID=UPI000D3E68F2|nr:polyhydroxyalkanoate synthesis repressor PhaR [Polynucleobacter rarus]
MATTKKTNSISEKPSVKKPAVKKTTSSETFRVKKSVKAVTPPNLDSEPFVPSHSETPSSSTQSKSRIIKKYPNRRLYDTLHSTYVTLFDIKGLVMSNIPFHVVDAKTGEDLTRSILMQIILEEESGGQPILSKQSLLKMIRFYGNSLQGMMSPFLEQNLNQFIELQNQYVAHCQKVGGLVSPETWVSFVNKQNTVEFTHPMSFLFETGSKILEQIQSQSSGVINSFPFKK